MQTPKQPTAKKAQKDPRGIPEQPQRAEDRPEDDEDTRPTNRRPAVSNPEDNSATSGDGATSIHPR